MSGIELPEEILHIIFSNVPGFTVLQCRKVCRRWRDAVDTLPDSCWKEICTLDIYRGHYAVAHEKHGLSWQNAYYTVHSWSKLNTAKMKVHELCRSIEMFKVLPNGIVAVLENNNFRTQDIRHFFCCDTIVYYDTEKKRAFRRLDLNFPFSSVLYDENEHLIVVFHDNGQMCIIIKETKERFFIGASKEAEDILDNFLPMQRFGAYALIDKEVYFQCTKNTLLYVARLVEKNGKKVIETKPLEAFEENHSSYEENVIAFSIKDGVLYILSDEGLRANIYIHQNANFSWATGIDFEDSYILDDLQHYGFNWRAPRLYHWLTGSNPFMKKVFFSEGLMVMGTRSYCKTICVHSIAKCHLSGMDDLDHVLKAKPLRRITMQEILPNFRGKQYSYIKKLDIIETGYAHKIVVMVENSLQILEFRPSNIDTNPKRKPTRPKPTSVVIKKAKVTATKKSAKVVSAKFVVKKSRTRHSSHKHVYATRSQSKL